MTLWKEEDIPKKKIKNCGCKLIKTCNFSSSQHEGMYFPAKEIHTRTTNLSSFYATLYRFINCSLPWTFL